MHNLNKDFSGSTKGNGGIGNGLLRTMQNHVYKFAYYSQTKCKFEKFTKFDFNNIFIYKNYFYKNQKSQKNESLGRAFHARTHLPSIRDSLVFCSQKLLNLQLKV